MPPVSLYHFIVLLTNFIFSSVFVHISFWVLFLVSSQHMLGEHLFSLTELHALKSQVTPSSSVVCHANYLLIFFF